MNYYIITVKDTGEIIKDSNGNLVTFTSEPKTTFNFCSLKLSEEQIEAIINNKLDNGI